VEGSKPDAPNKDIIRKFLKKARKARVISVDPVIEQKLTHEGYKLKAERKKIKRDRAIQHEREYNASQGRPGVSQLRRGDPGYISSGSSSQSSYSSVSFHGVPDVDLDYLDDQDKAMDIRARRDERRKAKWSIAFQQVVEQSVRQEISVA